MLSFDNPKDYTIALQILGSIDQDGYLRRDTQALVDDLMFTQNIMTEEEDIERVLAMIQRFDPPGSGARDLQECLELQLRQKLEKEKDRKSTRLNSSHVAISYAVFCLK